MLFVNYLKLQFENLPEIRDRMLGRYNFPSTSATPLGLGGGFTCASCFLQYSKYMHTTDISKTIIENEN